MSAIRCAASGSEAKAGVQLATAPTGRSLVFATLAAGVIVFAVLLRVGVGPHIRDDAYITLRYAENIGTGQGFVFNQGERVLGTTTPLYALLLAVPVALGSSPAGAAVPIGIAADAGAMVALGLLARRFLPRRAVLFVLTVYALLSPIVSYAVSGMETSFYILLILLSVLVYAARRMRLAAFFCALVMLTRPDGAILVAVLFLHAALYPPRRHKGLVAAGVVFAAVLAPWIVFSTVYFGSPFPQSMIAKMNVTSSDPFFSLRNLIWYFTDRDDRWFLPLVPLFVLGVLRAKRDIAWGALGFWALLYSSAFVITNKFLYPIFPFDWYFVPLLAPFALGVGAGLSAPFDILDRVKGRWIAWSSQAAALGVAVVFVIGYGGVLQFQHSALDRMIGGREEVYAKLAGRMAELGIQDEVVAAYEIGAFAYHYDGPILDLWGLVSPHVAGVDSAKVIESTRPPWIMTYADMLPPDLANADWFQQEYKGVYALGTWEGRRTTLFRRYPPSNDDSSRSTGQNVLAGSIQLLAVDVQVKPVNREQSALHVTLTWQALREIDRHYTVFVHLRDANNRPVAQQDSEPQSNQKPTNSWRVGETVVDKHDLVVGSDSLDGGAVLVVGAYETGSVEHLLPWSKPTVVQWPHELRMPLTSAGIAEDVPESD